VDLHQVPRLFFERAVSLLQIGEAVRAAADFDAYGNMQSAEAIKLRKKLVGEVNGHQTGEVDWTPDPHMNKGYSPDRGGGV